MQGVLNAAFICLSILGKAKAVPVGICIRTVATADLAHTQAMHPLKYIRKSPAAIKHSKVDFLVIPSYRP